MTRHGRIRGRNSRCGTGRPGFHSRRSEASPASLQNAVVLFRISSAEPLRHHDSGRDARGPSLEPRRGWRLGSDLGPRSDRGEFMLTFIDTNKLPRKKTAEGEVTEVLNRDL